MHVPIVLHEGGEPLSADMIEQIRDHHRVDYRPGLLTPSLASAAAEQARSLHVAALRLAFGGEGERLPFIRPRLDDMRICTVQWGQDPESDTELQDRIKSEVDIAVDELFLAAQSLSAFHPSLARRKIFTIFHTIAGDDLNLHRDSQEDPDFEIDPSPVRSIAHLSGARVIRFLTESDTDAYASISMDPGDAYTLPFLYTQHAARYEDATAIYVQGRT